MIKMIENLNLHKTDTNKELIGEIINYIKEFKIENIEQLSLLEDRKFTIDGKVLDNKERIAYCFSSIKDAYYDYDGMEFNQIKELKRLKDSLTTNIDDNGKILNLIKIYDMTNREVMFVKEAYRYIMKGVL